MGGQRSMLPTTYRGNATIDGETIDAVLRLDDGHLRLSNRHNSEILRWPLRMLAIESTKNGEYRLSAGERTFEFTPLIDDGLGDEIVLRTRFSPSTPVEEDDPAPQLTVADQLAARVTSAQKRTGLMERFDRRARLLMVLGAIAAGAILGIALWIVGSSGSPGSSTATTVAASDTLPFTPGDAPATTVASNTDARPDTVAGPTTTTPRPSTTLATGPLTPFSSDVFQLTSTEFIDLWSARAGTLDDLLTATEVSDSDGQFSFATGLYATISGSSDNANTLDYIVFEGDPSGDVSSDRRVLSAMGLLVAMVEPDLPPRGRRELVSALGLNVDNPYLGNLDGQLTYHERYFHLYWDSNIHRVVFEVMPASLAPAPSSEEAPSSEGT